MSYDCENTIADFNKVADNRFAYGVVKIDEFLNADELVNIVNESLTKDEQVKILKRTEHSKLDSQLNFRIILAKSLKLKKKKVLIVLNCLSLTSHLTPKVNKLLMI